MVSARNGCILNRVISTTMQRDADQRGHDEPGSGGGWCGRGLGEQTDVVVSVIAGIPRCRRGAGGLREAAA